MKQIFFGKTVNGVPKISRRNEMQEALLAFEGKEFQITIEKKKKSRSLNQNGYYHAVVVPMVRQGLIDIGTKLTREETHEILKMKFLKKEVVLEETGEILNYTGSSAELTTTQFMDYIAEIQQWAAEFLNIVIPDPASQANIEFEN
jgi:hypothetical protein